MRCNLPKELQLKRLGKTSFMAHHSLSVYLCVCVCVRGHWPLVPFVGPSTLRIRDRHKLIRVARAFHFIFADAIAIESSFHMIESCLCVSFAPVARSLPSLTLLQPSFLFSSMPEGVKWECAREWAMQMEMRIATGTRS